MADLIPQNFPIAGETSVTSYDFVNSILNLGYVVFYPLITDDSSGAGYSLTTEVLESSYNNRKIASTTQNVYVTQQFDITFNSPATIAGAVAQIAYTLTNDVANATGNAKFDFFHVRSAAETSIGTVTGASTVITNVADAHRLSTKATLTEKHFAVGDILRIKVGVVNSANANGMEIWVDPASLSVPNEADTSDTPAIPTNLKIQVPFKLNL